MSSYILYITSSTGLCISREFSYLNETNDVNSLNTCLSIQCIEFQNACLYVVRTIITISQTKIQGAVYTISSNFLFTSDGFLEWENQLGKVYIFRVVYTLTESLDTYVLLVPRFPIHNLTIYSLYKGRRTIL